MSGRPASAEMDATPVVWRLCLYVAGMTPTAQRALANLQSLCEVHLAGRYNLSVVDLLVEPQRAEADQIIAVPTLVRELPPPVRKIVGDLSNRERALAGLGVTAAQA